MNPIDKLIAADRQSPKRLAVIGEAMEDLWISGEIVGCQDACPCFKETVSIKTPGGAAGAARQLTHWGSEAWLIAPAHTNAAVCEDLNVQLCFPTHRVPEKKRFLVGDKIVFRSDKYDDPGWNAGDLVEWRELTIKAVKTMSFDGILISDYDKGFLDNKTIAEIRAICNKANVPIVSDAKRSSVVYWGTTLKSNLEWSTNNHDILKNFQGVVVTRGALPPVVNRVSRLGGFGRLSSVECLNHVGAGDCFAAHLLLGLVHGLSLEEAASIAHSAGRVYVQHRFGRPPWPHEIRKDFDPSGGKVCVASPSSNLAALRQSIPGRIVFTNGIFRLLHAGHVEMLRWARQQGDILVVGINDDASAWRARGGHDNTSFIASLEERMALLAALECVDWIVPFSENDPCATIKALKPDLLVKGPDYAGQSVPGDDLVEVRFAPQGASTHHASDVIDRIVNRERQ